MKYYLSYLIIGILIFSCSSKDENDEKLETSIFMHNKLQIDNLLSKHYSLGAPSASLINNALMLDSINQEVYNKNTPSCLQLIEKYNALQDDNIQNFISILSVEQNFKSALFEINKMIHNNRKELLKRYHFIEKIVPLAITDKESYTSNDSVEVTVYAQASFGNIIPIVTFDPNNHDLEGIDEYEQKSMHSTEIKEYDENLVFKFKVFAGDIKTDTIKGFFITPDPNGGDIQKIYSVPIRMNP